MEENKRYITALTIAGSDSGGGAGIQADLKTFSALGIYGTSAITAITAQNTCEVRSIEILPVEIIRQQLEAILDDIRIDAVKTGMLPSPGIVELVASVIDKYGLTRVVVDPVMVATTGARLSSVTTIHSIKKELFPRAALLTPNIPEAEVLSGISISGEKDVYKAAGILLDQGCRSVLIKGGHLKNSGGVDVLFSQHEDPVRLFIKNISTNNVHGTGCTLASAVTAYMASGYTTVEAVKAAKNYITEAIEYGAGIRTGNGHGPVNHFFNPQPLRTKKYENQTK